jgi:hypothetical protein
MESLLNLVWVLVSLFAVGAGVLHYRARRERRHSLWLVVVALAAVAVLLFPVISLTDDLNPAIFASEVLPRRDLIGFLAHGTSVTFALPVCLLAALLVGSLIIIAKVSGKLELANERAGFVMFLAGRAPPFPA